MPVTHIQQLPLAHVPSNVRNMSSSFFTAHRPVLTTLHTVRLQRRILPVPKAEATSRKVSKDAMLCVPCFLQALPYDSRSCPRTV